MPLLQLPTFSPILQLAATPPPFFSSSRQPRGATTCRHLWRQPSGFRFTTRPPPAIAAATSDQELLRTLVGPDSEDVEGRTHLPAVRTYENALARFTLVGAVGFDQAVVAASADGGDAAEEHLASGLHTMVIETVYPGGTGCHSTVSTRLFLPSREVKVKGRSIRSSLDDEVLSGTDRRNILAMTFRQVALRHAWNFELALFPPGTERDMGNLDVSREITPLFSISCSNDTAISMLAEAVCSCVLESTKRCYLTLPGGTTTSIVSDWFQKPQVAASSDSSIYIYTIPPNQIIENAQKRLDSFCSTKGCSSVRNSGVKHHWWPSETSSKLEKIGGASCRDWADEHVPAYRLQIGIEKFKDVKFQGLQNLADNRFEIVLTHTQMVELADILDMYYEDQYTLSDKYLPCGLTAQVSHGSKRERKISWKILSMMLLGGCVLFFLRIMAQICSQKLLKQQNTCMIQPSNLESEFDYFQPQILETNKLEDLCYSVVKRMQDALNQHEDVSVDKDVGAWTGKLPSFLRNPPGLEAVQNVSEFENSPNSSCELLPIQADPTNSETSPSRASRNVVAYASQQIASYQVVLLRDGKVIGIQPTSRAAVNHWAANPLSQALYEGKKLSPGLLEPRPKIRQPSEVAVIELLMSVDPDAWFVLARPFPQ